MHWSIRFAFAVTIFGSLIAAPLVAATPPWRSMLNIRRVESDPNEPYWLQEDNGPWCILATSFAGQQAEADAHRLVLELRKRFGLESFMHKQRYDFSQSIGGLGVDKYGAPKKMKYLRGGMHDEYAVLVGNFAAVDDPAVQKTLDKLKYAKPECLSLEGRTQSSQRFAGLRAMQRMVQADADKQRRGPMANAFVTRNPLLPQEFFAPRGVDKFVLEMNRDVQHSLLDCPGKYSVRVGTFRGNVILDQAKIRDIEQGQGMQTHLDQAADKAHRLTELLRAKGVEAYEFHDRHESTVTIGSFEAVGTPRDDGRIEINPAVHQIMVTYGGSQKPTVVGAPPGLAPKVLGGIPLDVQPVPVEVPRRSIGADYAGR